MLQLDLLASSDAGTSDADVSGKSARKKLSARALLDAMNQSSILRYEMRLLSGMVRMVRVQRDAIFAIKSEEPLTPWRPTNDELAKDILAWARLNLDSSKLPFDL